jgi:uncharacterized membrane protein YgaE (UPF0421/DUF939 family)
MRPERLGSALSSAARGARRRIADAGASVVQTPVAAGLAWYIAHTLLGHHQPFFAPTAAAVSISKKRALRGQRALQMIVGVLLGISVGTAVKAVVGSAPGSSAAVAIGVAACVTLVAALVLGAGFFQEGVLFVNQSQAAAILMIAVGGAATVSERVFDALIGGGVTLLITVILFPAAPLPHIQAAVKQVFAALSDTLRHLTELADAGARADPEWILASGRRVHSELGRLEETRSTARQVVNLAPRRWRQRSQVRQADQQAEAIGLLAASVLSLAHTSAIGRAVQRPHSPGLRQAMGELTSSFTALAERGGANATPAAAHALQARILATGHALTGDAESQLIARLIEICADDTLRLANGYIAQAVSSD